MPRSKSMTPEQAKKTYKHDYELQKQRGDTDGQLTRQKARRAYDAAGIDRTGMDIDHKKKIKDGGTSDKSNLRLRSIKKNRSDNGHYKGENK